MATKKYDLILFGATGFTGTQTLKHLAKHVPTKFKWAIGGRNKEKLEALLPLCEAAASRPSIAIADASDAKSVDKLVASTRCIIQLAGPYGKSGEVFVAAAAKQGTHYLDLTGEIGWVAQMIARHEEAAIASNAKIVCVSGYEALPFDIAALLIAEKLKAETGGRAVTVEVINRFTGPPAFRPRDVLSGGTMATIKSMLEAGQGQSLNDPAALVTDAARAQIIRNEHAYDLAARYSSDAGAWLAPTVPAPFINPPVVYRTMQLLSKSRTSPFATDCEYREAMSTKSFTTFPMAQRIIAEMLSRSFMLMAKSGERNGAFDNAGRSAVRQIMEWFGPASGEGPSEKHLEQSGYTLRMRATGASGASVTARGKANGHPGYKSTAMLVAEAGLLLAGAGAPGCAALPKRQGFLTPASAFGTGAQPAWARAELTFEI